jgi:predicted acyl esterase
MEIHVHSTANVFMKGHKIQLMIQSSNFPMWDRNLNTGNDPDTDKTIVVAHQKIMHDKDHLTHLVLPVTSDPMGRANNTNVKIATN